MEKAVDEELAAFQVKAALPAPSNLRAGSTKRNGNRGMIEGLQRLGRVRRRRGLTWNEYNHYLGNPGYFPEDLHRYQSATTDSIRAFAQAQLKPTARVVVYGIPGKPDLRTGCSHTEKCAEGPEHRRRIGQCRCGVARKSTKTRCGARAKSSRSRNFSSFPTD